MTSDKAALRDRMRRRRRAFAPLPLPVPPAFADRLTPGLTVAAYVPLDGEPDPAPLVAAARIAGCHIVLPHVVDRQAPLRFLDWDVGVPLCHGPFGLRQPHSDATERTPGIVLVPLVAFDRHGNRVGHGAGHYDRAFVARPQAWRIGIAWSVQDAGPLVPDPWDVPLHAILTEREWIVP